MPDITDEPKDFDTIIAELRTKYDAWDAVHVVQIEKLYDMLAETMKLVAQVRAENQELKVDGLLGARDIKVIEKATVELKVVKLALTKNNKRASSYARVLTIAVEEGIAPNNLKFWIYKKGGLENVRLKNTAPKKDDTKFEIGKKNLIAQEILLANFDVPDLTAQKNDIVVLVGRIADSGQIEVLEVAGVGDDAIVKEAITAITEKETAAADKPTNQDDNPVVEQLVATPF